MVAVMRETTEMAFSEQVSFNVSLELGRLLTEFGISSACIRRVPRTGVATRAVSVMIARPSICNTIFTGASYKIMLTRKH